MRRVIYYILLILLAFMLQTNVFQAIHLIDATPNLLLIITFCYGFIRGPVDGMLIGFFSRCATSVSEASKMSVLPLMATIADFVQ